jgi:hypothetical protein
VSVLGHNLLDHDPWVLCFCPFLGWHVQGTVTRVFPLRWGLLSFLLSLPLNLDSADLDLLWILGNRCIPPFWAVGWDEALWTIFPGWLWTVMLVISTRSS